MKASDNFFLPALLQHLGGEAAEDRPVIESGTGVALITTQ